MYVHVNIMYMCALKEFILYTETTQNVIKYRKSCF